MNPYYALLAMCMPFAIFMPYAGGFSSAAHLRPQPTKPVATEPRGNTKVSESGK